MLITIAGLAFIIHIVTYQKSNSPLPYYAPGDTLRFPFPGFTTPREGFYESLTLTDESNVSATVFLLKKKPLLTGLNRFSLTVDPSINPGDHYHLMYYLYPGANLTLHACTVSEPADFYIFRGERNFNAWKDDPKGSFWEEHLHISKTCPGNVVKLFNFTSKANHYYFAFYNGGSNSSTVHATLDFERPEYITANGSIVKMCEAGGVSNSSCTMDIPLTNTDQYNLLLMVSYPSDGNWNTKVKVDWFYSLRIWLCVLTIALPGIVFLVVILLLLFCFCIVCIGICNDCVDTVRSRKHYELLN